MTGLPTGSPAPPTPAGSTPDGAPPVVERGDHDVRLDRAALDRSLVRGVAWTGAIKWVTQIAAWLSTLAVARLLSPEDYGLVGMAAVYLGLLTMLSEAGLGTTIIAVRDLRGGRLAQMHALASMIGVAGFLVSWVVAGPLAAFFKAPLLRGVVIALSANFVIMSLRTVPQASLQRQLRFGRVALIDGANSLITAVTAVVLALVGFRYWALVIAALVGSVFATVIALTSQPVGFERPRPNELRDALRVSRDIIVSSVAWYVFQNADFFVAGKMLGAAALGAYTFAWNIAYSVVDKVTGLVTGVTSSIFSAAKHDSTLLTRYLTHITGALALALLPATAGLALVAPDLLVIVGDKWSAAVVPLQLLVLYAGVRALTPILSQALTITGDTRYTMKRSVVAAIILPIGFAIGARWGINGIATAWIVCHAPVVLLPLLRRVATHLGIGPRAYFPVLRPALVSTAIMAMAVLAVTLALPVGTPRVATLLLKIATGGITYAAALWLLFRERVLALVRATAQLRGGAPDTVKRAET
jgi:O-antigen/teichoic acid export membrane protein